MYKYLKPIIYCAYSCIYAYLHTHIQTDRQNIKTQSLPTLGKQIEIMTKQTHFGIRRTQV